MSKWLAIVDKVKTELIVLEDDFFVLELNLSA